MKNLNKFFVGAAALVLLTACGPAKVSYDKFHEKAAAAAEKDPGYTKATAKGTFYSNTLGVEVTIKIDNTFVKGDEGWALKEGEESNAGTLAAIGLLTMRASTVGEDEKTTYYAGNGFKVVTKNDKGDTTIVYNSNGYVTSYKGLLVGGDANLKFSWSK
jgi:hypothetical protein